VSDRCDVITVGETMAMMRTDDAQVHDGSHYTLGFGGAESNVAIGLARQGVDVAWYSALGADSFGDMIARGISLEGVRVEARIDPVHPTGMMVKSRSVDAERPVTYYRSGSAASQLTPADMERIDFDGVRMIHISGILPALSDKTAHLAAVLLQEGKKRSLLTSLDINYRPSLWSPDEARQVLEPLLTEVDIVFGDTDELSLVGIDASSEDSLAAALNRHNLRDIVVKRGSLGAVCMSVDGWEEVDAYPVTVVDTVGAGDAFVAGYLSSFLADEELGARLSKAAVCGALACGHLGDWEGSPRLVELEQAMTGSTS